MIEILDALDSWPSAASWLLAMTAASGLLLLLVFAVDVALARRVSAGWRSFLYLAVLLRLALPIAWATPVGMLLNLGNGASTAVQREPATSRIEAGALPREPVTPPAPFPHRSVGWPLLAWLTGCVALAARAVAGHVGLARALRAAVPARSRVSGLLPGIRVVEHRRCGPAALGALNPRVVVPTELADVLGDDELAAVLHHEAAHVRRRDPLRLLLLQLATIAAWPVLPAWLAASRVRGLMEQSCDELALADATPEARLSLCRALLSVAAWQPARRPHAAALLSFGGGLSDRLAALQATRRWPIAAQVPLVVLAAGLGVAIAATRPVRAAEPAPPASSIHVEGHGLVIVVNGEPRQFPPKLVIERVAIEGERLRLAGHTANMDDMRLALHELDPGLHEAFLMEIATVLVVYDDSVHIQLVLLPAPGVEITGQGDWAFESSATDDHESTPVSSPEAAIPLRLPDPSLDAEGFPTLSPFQAIRWVDDTPQVSVAGLWYELDAIDDLSASDIVMTCHATYGDNWSKRFGEDLVAVMTRMGHPPGDSVTLELHRLEDDAAVRLEQVPMSHENRQAMLVASRALLQSE